jgi:hypothetical protein
MIDNDKIESYLHRLGTPHDEVEDGFWVIRDDAGQIVVHHEPPVIVFRAKIADAPATGREALFERLLELNANDMLVGAYGLEGDAIVVVATLPSENLDYNEFLAAVDALQMAMTTDVPELKAHIAAKQG